MNPNSIRVPKFNFPTIDTSGLEKSLEVKRERDARQHMANELALANSADEFCSRLVKRIVDFETDLDETKEVGVRLVSFGQSITFHVRDLGYHNPSLIVFKGVTDDGNQVELIQHVSQISFLLMAVRRLEPDIDRGEFGFHSTFKKFHGDAP